MFFILCLFFPAPMLAGIFLFLTGCALFCVIERINRKEAI